MRKSKRISKKVSKLTHLVAVAVEVVPIIRVEKIIKRKNYKLTIRTTRQSLLLEAAMKTPTRISKSFLLEGKSKLKLKKG